MKRRRHVCDVKGCDRERFRWQRLCTECFAKLSRHGDIRYGILDAHRTGQSRLKRELARRAGDVLGYTEAPPAPPPAPARPQWWQRD